MKVGIITFHSAHNYGASLQTWALQKVLKSYGLEAYVIHYHPGIIDNLYDPIKKTGIKRPIRIAKLFLTNKRKLKRYYNYKRFIRKNLNLLGDFKTYEELKNGNLKLDAYITGSDQVWNKRHTGGFDPSYYLEFAEKDAIKIAYAVSIGINYNVFKYKDTLTNIFAGFNEISVREKSAVSVIQEYTGKQVKEVLDPTLLLKKEDYDEIKITQCINQKYIFVYMVENNNEVVAFANRMSKALGLPVIQSKPVKKFVNEIESCYPQAPGTFLGLVEGAELVITNSFHGTVFSIIYKRPFLSMLHTDLDNRVTDLLNNLGLSSHIVYNPKEFDDLDLAKLKVSDKFENILEDLKIDSLKVLQNALLPQDNPPMVECPVNIRKDHCYGCYACKEICPVNAITMIEDREGFKYPVADYRVCIQCGVCEKTCIRKNPNLIEYQPEYPRIYSAINQKDEVRYKSSSGGVFPELANYVISEKGFVVGVKFDENMNVVSAIAENMEEAKAFYGSKYVKSDFDGMFPKIKALLKLGKPVLYSGLPCECAGLRAFLKKTYDNLIIVELICHASPSPKVFRKYLDYLNKKFNSKVKGLEFRNKSTGWETHKCSMMIHFESGKNITENARKNNYFRAFLNDFISRTSCCYCNYTYKNRAGDITIGDFWGAKTVQPEMYDGKGCSIIMINNKKALDVWNHIAVNFKNKELDLKSAFKKNHTMPNKYKKERSELFSQIDKEPIDNLLLRFNDLKNK